MWSPETVVREIDHLVEKYGVKNIKFVDEMFVLNKRHVGAICDLLIERGHDLNIWAYARVDTAYPERYGWQHKECVAEYVRNSASCGHDTGPWTTDSRQYRAFPG
ncbi:MAG: hypothetical protein H7833_21250, partial [Magnetococcus sp. DMHC-1]